MDNYQFVQIIAIQSGNSTYVTCYIALSLFESFYACKLTETIMSNSAKAKGVVTAELRKSDGVCIARDLFATYPVRLHLTSRPNQDTFHQSHGKPICDGGETEGNRSKNEQKVSQRP